MAGKKKSQSPDRPSPESEEKNVYVNRKARHDYFLMARLEAGIALVGSMHINPYEKSAHFLPDPKRKRKLLLRRSEIRRLTGKVAEKGLTLVPLRVYLVRGRAKVELALAKGKSEYDKREGIKKREAARDMDRARRKR